MRTAIDWEDVRFFAALARHGSLSATARALAVNHATVARRVTGLEDALGTRLFERRPTGYELTEAGRLALDAAGTMESAASALPRLGPEAAPAGLVRITATPSLTEAFLIPHLAALQQRHPALDLELLADRRSISLARHEADLALRLGRSADAELIARRVASIRYGFYGTPAWRERLERGAPPVFVGFDEAGGPIPEADWLARRFPGLRLAFRTNSQMAQARAARAGCGLTLLPRFLVESDPVLVPVSLPELPPVRDLWLLTRPDVRRIPQLRVVADFLVDLFRRERSLFAGEC